MADLPASRTAASSSSRLTASHAAPARRPPDIHIPTPPVSFRPLMPPAGHVSSSLPYSTDAEVHFISPLSADRTGPPRPWCATSKSTSTSRHYHGASDSGRLCNSNIHIHIHTPTLLESSCNPHLPSGHVRPFPPTSILLPSLPPNVPITHDGSLIARSRQDRPRLAWARGPLQTR